MGANIQQATETYADGILRQAGGLFTGLPALCIMMRQGTYGQKLNVFTDFVSMQCVKICV